MNFSTYKATIAFAQIFFCGFVGGLIGWFYSGMWQQGLTYGMALGCGIFAASQHDTSKKPERRDHI